MKRDHSAALEALADLHQRNPLDVVEMFLERAAIREYDGGMSRADAERLAVEDVRDEMAHAHGSARSPEAPSEP